MPQRNNHGEFEGLLLCFFLKKIDVTSSSKSMIRMFQQNWLQGKIDISPLFATDK
jgi:hypothetical protein